MGKEKKVTMDFVNPYNFVPVNLNASGEYVDVTQKGEPLLTGYFDCRIKCRTPIAIPDTQHKEDNYKNVAGHCFYPFYKRNGVPVIPGSSLRGVIRSVYETLTDSCFGTMKADTMITARSNKTFQPGLLLYNKEKNRWELYAAKRYLLPVNRSKKMKELDLKLYGGKSEEEISQYKSGDKLFFEPPEEKGVVRDPRRFVKEITDKSGSVKGYFCAGEYTSNRRYASVFVPKRNRNGEKQKVLDSITDQDFRRLEAVLAAYRNPSLNKNFVDPKKEKRVYDYGSSRVFDGKIRHYGYQDYEDAKAKGRIPVYYSYNGSAKSKGRLYMSFAALGRKAYYKSLNDVAGNRAHQKCTGRKKLCPACALFGTIEGDKLGSRVRFTDAFCEKKSSLEKVCFDELSSPKMTYLPFYLRSLINDDDADDYTDGYDSDNLEIRGRKYYWHYFPRNLNMETEPTNRNAVFEVLKEGAEFTFRIYFDGISHRQMELLAQSLHFTENQLDGRLCHKIGHGKPLGFGSAKIVIENCKLRSFDPERGWKEQETPIPVADVHTRNRDNDITYKSLMRICNFDVKEEFGGLEIKYPRNEEINQNAGSNQKKAKESVPKWYGDNYEIGNKKPVNKLPEVLKQ